MIPFAILAIENDDDRAFMTSLYETLYPIMKATALRVSGNSDVAEGIVHDAIVALIKKIDVLRNLDKDRLKAYVCMAVRNTALNDSKRRQRYEPSITDSLGNEAAETVPDESATTEERVESCERYCALGRAMAQLPAKERDLLKQKYWFGYRDDMIASLLHIKKDSVREYLTRARRMLKEYLAGGGDKR